MSNSSITFLSIAAFIAVTIAVYICFFHPTPILSNRGLRSPYYVRGLFNPRVFFRQYVGDGLMGSQVYTAISDSDRKHFRVLDFEVSIDADEKGFLPFGVTGNQSYQFGRLLPFNPESEKVEKLYTSHYGPIAFVTEKSVYFWDGQKYKVETEDGVRADSRSFKRFKSPEPMSVNSYYFSDQQSVFYADGSSMKLLSGAKPQSFQILGMFGYAADSENVFYNGKALLTADRKTFALVYNQDSESDTPTPYESEYARDKKHVYKRGEILKDVDPLGFTIGKSSNNSTEL